MRRLGPLYVDGQFALLIKPNSAICSYVLYSGVYPIPVNGIMLQPPTMGTRHHPYQWPGCGNRQRFR
jgi:hypothetical protein